MTMANEVLCACADSCAKDAEIERLRESLRFIGGIAHADGIDHLATFCEQAISGGVQQTIEHLDLEPHAYAPSTLHMGDCSVCGNLQGSPIHSPFRPRYTEDG
jgi:hypothetical protein